MTGTCARSNADDGIFCVDPATGTTTRVIAANLGLEMEGITFVPIPGKGVMHWFDNGAPGVKALQHYQPAATSSLGEPGTEGKHD